jgi:hypothetical protein
MKSLLAVGIASSALIVSGCSNSASANIHVDRHHGDHSGSGQNRYDQDGDVSLIGSDMEINGRIGGDLSLIGSDLDVRAEIGGDMSLVGSDIEFDGAVGGEANIAGSDVDWTGHAERGIDIAGSDINWRGSTNGSLSIAGSDITIDGRISDDLDIAGSDVSLSRDTMIGGDLSIAGSDLNILAQISGDTDLAGNRIEIGGAIGGRLLAIAYPSSGWSWSSNDRHHSISIDGAIGSGSAVCARRVFIGAGAEFAGNLMIFADEPPTFENRLTAQNVTYEAINERDCDDLLDPFNN